jgi:hypothetical protein
MKPLTVQDLVAADAYERTRQEVRRRIIELKEHRRIAVGDVVTLVFENRETVLFQIQEMIRAERIDAPERLQEEVATYNEQVPGPGELSATLFIEITEPSKVKEILDGFQGIDKGQTVGLKVGDETVYALFEQGRAKEDKISAVHYLRFQIPEGLKAKLADFSTRMEIFIHHSGYQARVAVPDTMRLSLLQDLN